MLANNWESTSLRDSQGFKLSSLSPLGLWLCNEYSGVTGVCPLNWTCHLELRARWPRKKTIVRSRERSQWGRLGHMSQRRPSESHLGESEARKEVSDAALSRSCVGQDLRWSRGNQPNNNAQCKHLKFSSAERSPQSLQRDRCGWPHSVSGSERLWHWP